MKKLPSNIPWLFPNFRQDKKGAVVCVDKPIAYGNMLNLFKAAVSSVGEDGNSFALHSPRTGAVSEAANSSRAASRTDIQRHGRWKSLVMVDNYHELSLEKKLAPSRSLEIYD